VQAAFGNQLSTDLRREAIHVEGEQPIALGQIAVPVATASFFLGRLDITHQRQRHRLGCVGMSILPVTILRSVNSDIPSTGATS
jgi:hypothetical protein